MTTFKFDRDKSLKYFSDEELLHLLDDNGNIPVKELGCLTSEVVRRLFLEQAEVKKLLIEFRDVLLNTLNSPSEKKLSDFNLLDITSITISRMVTYQIIHLMSILIGDEYKGIKDDNSTTPTIPED